VALSALLFAAMAVCARALVGLASPGQVVVIRFALGILALVPLYAMRRRWPSVRRPRIWVLRGALGGGAVLCYFVALGHLPVGPATLIHYTAPCFAALFAGWVLRERVTARLWTGLAIALGGAALVVLSTLEPGQGLRLGVGVWAGLGGAVLNGASMVALRELRVDTDSPTVYLSFCVFGLLFAAPFAAARWLPLSAQALPWLLAVAALSLAAQLALTHAFRFVSAASGGAMVQLTPAFSWGLGVAVLGERLTALGTAGAVVCIVGVLWGAGMLLARPAPIAATPP
jgi:drug/metabolite transporter (DMT)-like permease